MGIHDVWLFLAVGVLLNITPGPDMALIIARSTQQGTRAGIAAALGVAAGALYPSGKGRLAEWLSAGGSAARAPRASGAGGMPVLRRHDAVQNRRRRDRDAGACAGIVEEPAPAKALGHLHILARHFDSGSVGTIP